MPPRISSLAVLYSFIIPIYNDPTKEIDPIITAGALGVAGGKREPTLAINPMSAVPTVALMPFTKELCALTRFPRPSRSFTVASAIFAIAAA